jgi:transposase
MYPPVLSIDVSKDHSVAAAFLSLDDVFRKPFSFPHTPSGLGRLLSLLMEMQHTTDTLPYVVLEATGHYSRPIVAFFEKQNIPVVVLNPVLTHQQKQKSIRKVKTDSVDAIRIAQVFYLQHPKTLSSTSPEISELRVLCRQHDALTNLYAETQLHFQAVLDLLFPGYDKVFSKTCCLSSLRILENYPSPKDVLDANREDLIRLLLLNRRGERWNEAKMIKLLAIAAESLPDPAGQHANITSLRTYIKLLGVFQQSLEQLQEQMISQAEMISAYSLLRSIPGVGPLTAATILAEIGDIQRFPSVKQLTAFAGLDPSVFESGTFKSKNNKISKRGSVYLRKALYQATVAGISRQAHGIRNPILFEYYQRKILEGKKPKVAIIATSHKLLRIIYGIWTHQTPFVI